MIIYNLQSHILGFKTKYTFTMGMMNFTRKEGRNFEERWPNMWIKLINNPLLSEPS
jgi:hypothetical protein